jgi:hypothetical protein
MREETCWKNFSRQTDLLAIKFSYRHCPISMPVTDTILLHQKNGLIGGGSTVVVVKFGPESCSGNKAMAQRQRDPHRQYRKVNRYLLYQFQRKQRRNSAS